MIDIQITYMQIIETLSRSLYSNTDNNNIPYAYSSGYSTRVASISGTIYTTASINNPVYAQSVSQQTILNDIKSYVSRLGIDINAKPTARGLVAFFNAMAAFISSSITFYTSEFASRPIRIYSSSSSSAPILTQWSGDVASAAEVNDMNTSLTSFINGTSRVRTITYSYSVTSCSSSSSCSCSSSSSSTSVFIAYYKF